MVSCLHCQFSKRLLVSSFAGKAPYWNFSCCQRRRLVLLLHWSIVARVIFSRVYIIDFPIFVGLFLSFPSPLTPHLLCYLLQCLLHYRLWILCPTDVVVMGVLSMHWLIFQMWTFISFFAWINLLGQADCFLAHLVFFTSNYCFLFNVSFVSSTPTHVIADFLIELC